MNEFQIYRDYIKKEFMVFRKKGQYSPLYFVPQKWIKDKMIFVVGDSVSNENDYKREVTTKPYSEIFNEIELEEIENPEPEFIRAIVEYIKDSKTYRSLYISPSK